MVWRQVCHRFRQHRGEWLDDPSLLPKNDSTPSGLHHFVSLPEQVEIETDAGITGWGENCPLGSCYLPAYAKGTR
jgi:hypothetical protein